VKKAQDEENFVNAIEITYSGNKCIQTSISTLKDMNLLLQTIAANGKVRHLWPKSSIVYFWACFINLYCGLGCGHVESDITNNNNSVHFITGQQWRHLTLCITPTAQQ